MAKARSIGKRSTKGTKAHEGKGGEGIDWGVAADRPLFFVDPLVQTASSYIPTAAGAFWMMTLGARLSGGMGRDCCSRRAICSCIAYLA